MKKIKITKKQIDSSIERKFLIGSIMSDRFLKEASAFYDPSLVEAKYVLKVSEWCFQYFQKYQKAPGKHIQDIYEAWEDKLEKSERELIKELLISISDEYERADKLNVEYLLDQTEKHFRQLSLEKLSRQIKGLASDEQIEEAEALIGNYKRVGRPGNLGANPFKDAERIQQAFEKVETPLFTFPGKLGKFLNPVLCRGHFIGLLGPEKRGKTWWLNEFAIRAARARCNVALFQIGDMSEAQITVRLCIRLAGKSNLQHLEGEKIAVPVLDCLIGQQGKCKKKKCKPLSKDFDKNLIKEYFEKGIRHKVCTECKDEKFFKGSLWYKNQTFTKALTWREAYKVGNKFLGRIKGRDFMLSTHSADQLSVSGIKNILDSWEIFENFIPDVIIIDYADNLAPEKNNEDKRDQQNRTWKMLRGLSLDRHCLVAVATQADAASYNQTSLTMNNFSEDKRKFAHVTGMFGLNQTPAEKRLGIMRINTLVLREGRFDTEEEVSVAQCLEFGKPCLFSF